jgi:hypothetical protein
MVRKPGIGFLDTLSRVMTRGKREKSIVNNDRDQKQYLDKLKNEEEKHHYTLRDVSSHHSHLIIGTAPCHC